MSVMAAVIGIGLPTCIGWLAVRLVEGRTPVLFHWERWVVGFVLGGTLAMFAATMLEIAGVVRFTLLPMLIAQLLLLLGSGIAWQRRRRQWTNAPTPTLAPSKPMPVALKILLTVLALWTLGKILGSAALMTLPPYFDDTLKYWNLRGKIFLATEELSLSMDPGNPAEISGLASYPSTLPLFKAWLTLLAGGWYEWLVNLPHLLWYVAALALVYSTLRRSTSRAWAYTGTYLLSSLPLPLMHASGAYADSHVALHVFLAVAFVFHAFNAPDARQRHSYFRLGALAAAILVFTKNEALIMHLPTLLAVLMATLAVLLWKKGMDAREMRAAILTYAIAIGIVALPWIAYKLSYGLPFGNAKPIPTEFAFQPAALRSIGINLFLEGNWNLLPVVFLGLLAAQWRRAFTASTAILVGYVLLFMIGQLPIFLFTGLSIEAQNQTAFARGVLQVAPVAVLAVILMARSAMNHESCMRNDGDSPRRSSPSPTCWSMRSGNCPSTSSPDSPSRRSTRRPTHADSCRSCPLAGVGAVLMARGLFARGESTE